MAGCAARLPPPPPLQPPPPLGAAPSPPKESTAESSGGDEADALLGESAVESAGESVGDEEDVDEAGDDDDADEEEEEVGEGEGEGEEGGEEAPGADWRWRRGQKARLFPHPSFTLSLFSPVKTRRRARLVSGAAVLCISHCLASFRACILFPGRRRGTLTLSPL